uniref:Uncharacterized protein n=1 Tax=Anopheles culicifacies TaxID=139723 RepID=A0A182MBF8_9DIPT
MMNCELVGEVVNINLARDVHHIMVHTTTAIAVGGGTSNQVATVASAKHTASDHLREVLGHVFGRDDRSYSGSHSSSSSDERRERGDRWGRKRDTCRYVSRSGKFCKCNCYDRDD